MAEGTGQVAVKNIGVQVGGFAAAYGGDEVGEMVAGS